MAALLALLCAVVYGAGDFFGGLAARRLAASLVVLRSNIVGLTGLLVAAPWFASDLRFRDFVFGGAGGLAGGIGVLLLYRGLATGTMSVVAPITAVLSAVVPVAVGLASGERPTVIALAGVPMALVAVAMLAREPVDDDKRTNGLSALGLLTALGAGFGFGLFFVALDATSDDAGLWPVVAGRTASVAMFTVLALARGRGRRAPSTGAVGWLVVWTGVFDAGANALFLLATQQGLLTLVSVLAALYPASTILLARLVLGERLARPQQAGVLLAGAAVVLVTAG